VDQTAHLPFKSSSILFVCTIKILALYLKMKASNSRYSKCVYFASNALARKIEKLASISWKSVDLSPSHAYLLMVVLDEPGIQPGALVNELLLTPSTITRLLDKLEAKKLVKRTAEGKTINIFPTSRARNLQPQLKKCSDDFLENYSGILGKADSEKLSRHLNKITDKL
jgi:DNA-binding MarR family transcriptional regulator